MADENAIELLKRGDKRFGARQTLDTFRQEIALNFCPWHASFTTTLNWGEDFAAHLLDGTPLLLARDFKGQIGSMLRPPGKQWFWDRAQDEDVNVDRASREYLDWRSRQKMRLMFDRATGAHRAFSQADEFFAFFGDAVVSVDLNATREQLRFMAYHIKDVVWALGDDGKANVITRREEISVRNFLGRFRHKGDKIAPEMKEKFDKDPDQVIKVRHEIIEKDEYDSYRKGPRRGNERYVSVWIDETHKTVVRETPQRTMRYVVASWVRLPHMPYAISPATTIALPDARLIQQQALAIMDAAEKGANPPLIATVDAIRGQVDAKSNGITWIERDYDERMGEPLRPLEMGKNAGLGAEALLRTEHQLTRAFYLDSLRMPDTRSSKSTLEIQFRIDEYVRAALPLFAPMQTDYNEALLAEVDAVLVETDFAKTDMEARPDALRNERMIYQWDNPLSEMIERQKVQVVSEVVQIGMTLAGFAQAQAQVPELNQVDIAKTFREAAISLNGSRLLLTEQQVKKQIEGQKAAQAEQAQVAQATEMAPLIDSGVNAAKTMSEIPMSTAPGYPMLPAPA